MRLIDADELNNDLISRSALINSKTEFMNYYIILDTKYRTTKYRIYAKAWNACNSYWLNTIDNAPTVEPDVNCSHCDYFKFTQTFVDNIAEFMADYNIETYDDLMNVINRVKDELNEAGNVKPCSSCAHFNNGNRKPYPCGSCFINSHNMWEANDD